MKKYLYLMGAVTLVFAACSEVDKPAELRVPVALTYRTVQAVDTRAAQNLNDGQFSSGEAIAVRISNHGAGEWQAFEFTTGEAGAMVAGDPAPFYPAGDTNIDIAACYPASAGTSFSVQTDQTSDEAYKASDLMFASVADQAKQAGPVALTFSHIMAKINVNITPGSGVSSIESVSILNVKPMLSFDPTTGMTGEADGSATSISSSPMTAPPSFLPKSSTADSFPSSPTRERPFIQSITRFSRRENNTR